MYNAPVAQLDRVTGFEPVGREFESLQARHFSFMSQCFAAAYPPRIDSAVRSSASPNCPGSSALKDLEPIVSSAGQETGYAQGYPNLLAEIKQRIRSAQYAAPKVAIEQELETQVEE